MAIQGRQKAAKTEFPLRRKRTARQRYGPDMRVAGSGPAGATTSATTSARFSRKPCPISAVCSTAAAFCRAYGMIHAAATNQILPAAVRGAEFYARRTALQCRTADAHEGGALARARARGAAVSAKAGRAVG